MKKQEKKKVDSIIEQCIDSLHLWDKKSIDVFHILGQMIGLRKSKWELFELSLDIRESVEENLKMRLYEELDSLSSEITSLESRLQELEHIRSSLQSRCSTVDDRYATSLEGFYIINNMCTCLHLIIGMKRVPFRRITIEDRDTFQFLKDSNESGKEVIKQFEEKVEAWREIVLDV